MRSSDQPEDFSSRMKSTPMRVPAMRGRPNSESGVVMICRASPWFQTSDSDLFRFAFTRGFNLAETRPWVPVKHPPKFLRCVAARGIFLEGGC